MKKIITILLLLFVSISLSACGDEEKNYYSVTLYVNGEVYQTHNEVEEGNVLDVTLITPSEGEIFTGWTDETSYYYEKITVRRNLELHATFEVIDEVFEYGYNDINEGMTLSKYKGTARFLEIPQLLDGEIVKSIATNSFENSSLIEVYVPVEAYITREAFNGSNDLELVEFYGEFLEGEEKTMPKSEYDSIMNDNNCVIVEGDEENHQYKFNTECPIMEVTGVTDSVIVNGVEYFNYYTVVNKNLASLPFYSSFSMEAFTGTPNIKKIVLSKATSIIYQTSFTGLSKLEEVIIPEENHFYKSVDGIVYSKDETELVFVPQNHHSNEFRITGEITEIRTQAFFENESITKLVIEEDFDGLFQTRYLKNLEEIVVTGDSDYYVIDNVLFYNDYLVKYPAKKTGTTYDVPEDITYFSEGAFSHNQYLDDLNINLELNGVGRYAFYNTQSLETLILPRSCEFVDHFFLHESSITRLNLLRNYHEDGSITMLMGQLGDVHEDLYISTNTESKPYYLFDTPWESYIMYFYKD